MIGERIKYLRKYLNLTLEEFGKRLGVSKNAISTLERGINKVTEQMAKSICREFGVDYTWLTTGDGEMFNSSNDDIDLDEFAKARGMSDMELEILKLYFELDADIRERLVHHFVDGLARADKHQTTIAEKYNIPNTPEELEKFYPPIDVGKNNESAG